MHCRACDCLLNDFESTRKSNITNEYIDLCSDCYSTISDQLVDISERIEEIDPEDPDGSMGIDGWMEAL